MPKQTHYPTPPIIPVIRVATKETGKAQLPKFAEHKAIVKFVISIRDVIVNIRAIELKCVKNLKFISRARIVKRTRLSWKRGIRFY